MTWRLSKSRVMVNSSDRSIHGRIPTYHLLLGQCINEETPAGVSFKTFDHSHTVPHP